MERNTFKIVLIIFAAAVVLLVPWGFIVAGPIWAKRDDNVNRFNNQDDNFITLKKMSAVYLGKSDQPPSPADAAGTFLDGSRKQADAVAKKISDNEKAFESFFNGAETMDAIPFRTTYLQYIPGDSGLERLLVKEGIYDAGPVPPTGLPLLEMMSGSMTDTPRALQKKVWIYQRLTYSLLKNSPADGTRLIVKLVTPEARNARYGIVITGCEDGNEKDKAEANIAAKEPIFYGGPRIPEIRVSFAVIIDERHIPEFLRELSVYNAQNPPIVGGAQNATPVPGLGEVKPITFVVEKMTIRRITPPENPLAPEPGKVIEADPEINALHPWVKIELTLKVPDFNPKSGDLKPPGK
jgi:hypothetical protein